MATMREVWRGEAAVVSGPIPALPPGRPGILLAGVVPTGFARVATLADGWVLRPAGWTS
jgi:hypothetical protein